MSLDVDIQATLGRFKLDAQLQAGQGATVIYGRSGSGKTSLINAIAGLSSPQSGRITLDEQVLFDAALGINVPVHLRRIGYVFQDARLFPHLNVADNLDFGTRYADASLGKNHRKTVIEMLGIGALMQRRPGALSGGEKQRVALGRALLTAPRLLLLDEPLAALDTQRKEEILPYFERLRAQGGPPMIYVTHDMSEIVRLADHLCVLRDGKSVAQGTAEDVLADPANMKLIGVQDAGALITGVVDHHASDGLSGIRLSAGMLFVPRMAVTVGTSVRIRIRAQDVILSLSEPKDMSSQNVLPAKITAIREGASSGFAIALSCGTDRLLARITARALAQMELKVGQNIWAVLKANAMPPNAIAPS